jgi:hypothetical protein
MNNTTKLGLAIAATLGAGAANATIVTATLTQYATYSNNGSAAGNITSSSATWQYDDVTGVISQTGGTFNARFTTAPTSTLFRATSTGLSFGAGGSASATTYSCIEGNFGGGVGASICGNYNFGANFVNESTLTYSGSSVTRTLGGDDGSIGAAQSVADLNGISTLSWVGTTLQLTNRSCVAACTTNAPGTAWNKGYLITFNAAQVPVPAAVWLFGSAVGLLGVARRRARA